MSCTAGTSDDESVAPDARTDSDQSLSQPISGHAVDPFDIFHKTSRVLLGIGVLWLLINWVFPAQNVWLSRFLCYDSWACIIFLAAIFFGSLESPDRQYWIDGLMLKSSVSPDNAFLEGLLIDWLLLYSGPILFCLNCLIGALLRMKCMHSRQDGATTKQLISSVCLPHRMIARHNRY